MAFTLNDIVPWGRSYDEYVRMFALEETELRLRILGCADGPASFNAEAARRGMQVISCDPLYAFGAAAVRERIDATSPDVLEQTRKNAAAFVWNTIASVEDLGIIRKAAMAKFLEDYDPESAEGSSGRRYVAAALPDLPFLDAAFDLALCSHFLFSTAITLAPISTLTRCASCVASHERYGSFRYSRSMESAHRSSRQYARPSPAPGRWCRWNWSRTSSSAAETR
jgi:hypothetical protein